MKRIVLLCAVLLAATLTPVFAQEDSNPMVVLHTNLGDITVEVFADDAPITAENFLQYVKDGFYDGTIFHRVIPGFVIQRSEERRVGKESRSRRKEDHAKDKE